MASRADAMAISGAPDYSIWRVILASSVGTMIEWYDFYIFGSLAVVLSQKFYPPGNATFAFIAYLATFAIGPRCIDSIVIDRDIAGYLNCELLDRVGVKGNVFGRVRSDPVGDVILSHGRGTDKWPADKIRVPQRPILLQVVGLHVFPVRFF